jgi:hypothetical protein
VTDGTGTFALTGVPTGKQVPVTVQIGKWRRTIFVAITADCQVNAISLSPASSPLLRLPAKRAEGDMPQLALLTGGCDNMACLLTKIGIASSEFGAPHSGGRVDVYQGLGATGPGPALAGAAAGDCTGQACPLWNTKQSLESYDIALLGCECAEHNETKPPAALQAMHDWLGEGGRVLATHYQATWFKNGPADFQGAAAWLASETDGPAPGPFAIDSSWIQGQSFKVWLNGAGALNPDGTLPLDAADVSRSVSSVTAPTSRWIYDSASSGAGAADAGASGAGASDAGASDAGASDAGAAPGSDTKVLSFRTPVGGVADAGQGLGYCGEAVFTDIHPGGSGVSSAAPVPTSCAAGASMTAEEKALEYLFFALSETCRPTPPQKALPGL